MKKMVEVVLLENIEKIGLCGDKKKIIRGYVKNYLLPKKLAVLVNDPKAKELLKSIKVKRERQEKEILGLKKLAAKISQEEIKLFSKAHESGKLFGSVTGDDVAKKLKLEKNLVKMEPIRSTGQHQVKINLGYEVSAIANIIVESEKAKKTAKNKKK